MLQYLFFVCCVITGLSFNQVFGPAFPSLDLQHKSLGEKQRIFPGLVSDLIREAERQGYQVTLGELWRPFEIASFKTKIYAEQGKGILESLHTQRLAIDINLFKSGRFLTDTHEYLFLGQWWESQCNLCRWGGRFRRQDGNHFSIEHNGKK